MNNYDIRLHVQGKSQFADDLAMPDNTLHAFMFTAPAAKGKILKLDISEAQAYPGVYAVFTWQDIPGTNQIGHIIHDEPLFAEHKFEFAGQPIALVVAATQKTARLASRLIHLEYEELPAVFSPRQAYLQGEIIGQERIFSCGNIAEGWKQCKYVFEGTAESGAQEHLYLETQGSLAIPLESGRIKVSSSTQSPAAVQKTVADVLGVSLNQVEVDVIRIGGGFGGKEDQANAYAAMAALAASKLSRPVKLILPRHIDMIATGKRHPYSSDFKIGLDENLKILAYEVCYYQNAGAFSDLSPAILERTMFHITNSYFIPNVHAKGVSCRTNLAPNTAYRGFGGPQAMFVLESAIYEAARKINVSPFQIQQKNLIQKGQTFPYGMAMQNNHALVCWEKALSQCDFPQKSKQIETFNSENTYLKKGLTCMPVCFGISFTNTMLNQANSLVHVYNDGSVSISTGAIEMGQGVNEKIRRVASMLFSISLDKIRTESTNTTRTANVSPTAASSGADLNGNATRLACEEILGKLLQVAKNSLNCSDSDSIEFHKEKIFKNGKETELGWEELVMKAYRERVALSAHGHYATPEIFFDRTKEKGRPFSYHVTGTAIFEVTLDCRRGTFTIDTVDVIHDTGNNFAPKINLGQMEGGIVQGIGWITMEDIQHSPNGKLLTSTLSTYKVPDILSVPQKMNITFLESEIGKEGIFGSKAVGEPPFMYGIGVYFALLNAIVAANPHVEITYSAPFTNEKVLNMVCQNKL